MQKAPPLWWLLVASVAGCAVLIFLLVWAFSGTTKPPETPKVEVPNTVQPVTAPVASQPAQPNEPAPAARASSGVVSRHLSLATDAYTQGQYQKAVREYQAVLKLDPKNAEARAGLQTVHAAMEAETRAGLASGGTEATLKRAEESYSGGEYSAAIAGFQQVLGQDPGNARAKKGLANAKAAYQAEQQAFGNTK
jgi:tetratricopeptide (TPR) repeat protein